MLRKNCWMYDLARPIAIGKLQCGLDAEVKQVQARILIPQCQAAFRRKRWGRSLRQLYGNGLRSQSVQSRSPAPQCEKRNPREILTLNLESGRVSTNARWVR